MVTANDVRIMAAMVRNNDDLGGQALQLMHKRGIGPCEAVELASQKIQEENRQAAELVTKPFSGKE